MRKLLIGSVGVVLLFPGVASAGPCAEMMRAVSGQTAYVDIATMNDQGSMTYTTAQLRYTPPLVSAGTRFRSGRWNTTPAQPALQYFSDRLVRPAQRFAVDRPDRVAITIIEEDPPVVQLNFFDRRNVVAFAGSCSPNGIIHGSVRNMDILVSMGPPHG